VTRTTAHRNIQRIDNESNRTHAWLVVVQRRGKIYSKMFSDGRHGGKRKALQAAVAYRDKLIQRHPPLSKKAFVSILKKNNRSGVPGVCRIESITPLRDGSESCRVYWVASWAISYKRNRQIKYSVDRYGEEGAFKRACATRRRMVRQLEDDFLTNQGQ